MANRAENSRNLGPFEADNGKINAIIVARLFAEDVLFFPETQLERSQNQLSINLQFNSQKADEYPSFASIYFQKPKELLESVMDLFASLDTADELQVPGKKVHKKMLKPLLDDRLTGLSFLNLMAYHMVKIVEKENPNEYLVTVDRNVITGIPDAYQYICRFIYTARKYNARIGKFSVQFMLARNLDSPITDISEPVAGAVEAKAICALSVQSDGTIEECDASTSLQNGSITCTASVSDKPQPKVAKSKKTAKPAKSSAATRSAKATSANTDPKTKKQNSTSKGVAKNRTNKYDSPRLPTEESHPEYYTREKIEQNMSDIVEFMKSRKKPDGTQDNSGITITQMYNSIPSLAPYTNATISRWCNLLLDRGELISHVEMGKKYWELPRTIEQDMDIIMEFINSRKKPDGTVDDTGISYAQIAGSIPYFRTCSGPCRNVQQLCLKLADKGQLIYYTNSNQSLFALPTLEAMSRGSYCTNGETHKRYRSQTERRSGCYIATAVYGSYDCPQVWTLRRYRDYTLAKTGYGRAFIRTYYAISPMLVKWFGKKRWFAHFWKKRLDSMVEELNKAGYEDSPYNL